MLRTTAAAIGVIAALAWVYALANWIAALRHRRPDLTLGSMLLRGTRSFDAASFTPEGLPHHRRFLIGAAVFGASVLAGIALALVAAASGRG